MAPEHNTPPGKPAETNFPAAETGNASNPAPHNDALAPGENQLLSKEAEKYLREAASIEDLPDAQDQQEMDETLKDEKAKG